jgi:serine/threonine protein kinase
METASLTVESLCNLLVRSRLVPPTDVQKLHRRWRLEAKAAAGDVDRFSRWLVANEYATDYQVTTLLRGHVDNFFLGHYKILSRIGKGRMAGVYKAVHNLGYVVAVKILPPSKADDPKILARFQREARMALRLQHANVVRTFQLGNSNGLVYLVMEYLEGESLEEVLARRGKLPVGEGVRVIHQALLGLQHIHEKGLVHRDLKPANLMLVPAPPPAGPDATLQATLKILDIGLGRDLFADRAEGEPEPLQLTSEGAVLGTPDYLAPEQARNAHAADIRADVYSLGCVLYRVLAGRPPFPDKNIVQQVLRHATEEVRPIRELEPGVPEGLQQVISRMVAKAPKQRYATPLEAAQALQPYLPDQAPPRAADVEVRLQSFLRWVEENPEETSDTPVPLEPAAAFPSAYDLQPLAESADVALPRFPFAGGEAPSTKVNKGSDTDLVLPPRGRPPEPDGPIPGLSRRESFLLGIGIWLGAGAVLLVEAVAWLILQFAR